MKISIHLASISFVKGTSAPVDKVWLVKAGNGGGSSRRISLATFQFPLSIVDRELISSGEP